MTDKQEELEQRVQALEKAVIHLQEDSRQNHQISEKIITKLENIFQFIYRVLGYNDRGK